MGDVSLTRLYIGNLPRNATKQEVEEHFNTHGTGKITEIKLMNGFGFIEYEDPLDARDVVPACHGSMFKGERLTVQFARGPRQREAGPPSERAAPRPRRTIHRMQITGLPAETSWQDLKDFARQSQLDVVYSETGRERDGRGFVEFETADDLRTAVEKLDNKEFKGTVVHCVADPQTSIEKPRDPYRARSPMRGRGYPPGDDYDRRGPPPRGYSPRGYRERSPPGRRPYYDDYGRRTPPRGRFDDYPPPPPRRFDDPYGDPRGPPPRPYGDPYAGGRDYPPRPRSPPRGYNGYDDRRPYY